MKIVREINYQKLRERFLQAASSRSARLESRELAATFAGEKLFIDVASFGSLNPRKVFLSISGTHGVEGYFASAIQSSFISEDFDIPSDSAVIFIHGLNPYGMAALRRFNENNVDLNRNFFSDFQKRENKAYSQLSEFIANKNFASRPNFFYGKSIYYILRYGLGAMKQAIAGGQSEYPNGIYYTGHEMQESNVFFKAYVQENFAQLEKLYVAEIHSGLGKWGENSLYWQLPNSDNKTLWLENIIRQKLLGNDAGPGYESACDLQGTVPQLIPNVDTYWVLQEFGAYNILKTFKAICDENAYHQAGGRDVNHWTKQQLAEVFCPVDEGWQRSVQCAGKDLIRKMLSCLKY